MIAELTDRGVTFVKPMEGVQDTLAFLERCSTYPGHVKGASVAVHQPGNSTCWAPEDVLLAPHFFEFALQFTDVVGEYLGQEPLLYSVNAFTTYPIDGPMNPDIQEWHRDKDDVKFVALFVYLTDVAQLNDGPHLFQQGTHRGVCYDGENFILGNAGTAFFADTRGLHMGLRPTTRQRSIMWARWCVSDPPASYVWDKQRPVSRALLGVRYPTDQKLRNSIRLVVS